MLRSERFSKMIFVITVNGKRVSPTMQLTAVPLGIHVEA